MESSDGMHKQYAGTVIKFAAKGWAACPFSDRIILETRSRNINIHRYREADDSHFHDILADTTFKMFVRRVLL
jgi:uncharacterized protein YutE (UPF0331/DUF86 family)